MNRGPAGLAPALALAWTKLIRQDFSAREIGPATAKYQRVKLGVPLSSQFPGMFNAVVFGTDAEVPATVTQAPE